MANESSLDALLDRALAAAFRAPAAPSDLRAQVLAAVARDHAANWEGRRRELENEHGHAIANLNARYLRRCRDALLAGFCVAVTMGLAVRPLSHWLAPYFDSLAPGIAGLLALSVGVLLGAVILQDLFGRRPQSLWPWRSRFGH
jgi:hypothetical protein